VAEPPNFVATVVHPTAGGNFVVNVASTIFEITQHLVKSVNKRPFVVDHFNFRN